MFPLEPEALDGRRVLLILVAEDPPWPAAFVTGIARWRESRLSFEYGQPPSRIEVSGSREALLGWDPAVLPRLIVSAHAPTVLALAAGVDACVSAFAAALPPGVLTLSRPFFGMGKNHATGACLLFQGPAEVVSSEEDVFGEPWASEPWTPDSDAWNSDEEAT